VLKVREEKLQREAEKSLKKLIENPYNRQNFVNFLLRVFPGADIWTQAVKNLPIDEKFKDKILEAEVIGEYQEEEIAFLAIKVSSPEKLRKYHRDFVARYLEEEGKEGALVAFYSDDSPVWRLSYIQMEYEKSKEDGRIKKKLTNFRRFSFIVGEGKASKTTLLQLSEFLNLENPTAAQLLEIFSVDSLNERFFEEYIRRFVSLWRIIYKQVRGKELPENAKTPERFSKEAAHQLLNRLIFIYFIQEKEEWFEELKGQKLIDFLVSEYKRFVAENPEKEGTFYSEWLKPLFLSAFSQNMGEKRAEIPTKYSYLPEKVKELFIRAPYLNGGLFSKNDYDRVDFQIPDEFFLKSDQLGKKDEGIIPFLNSYNFTMVEDLEDDRDLAVNPEFIGTIYEKLVHLDSKEVLKNPEAKIDIEGVTKGIVYTKEPEIKFIITQSLIYYLRKNTSLPEETVYDFIFNDDFLPEDRQTFEELKRALDELKVVDPACGSGAFLVGLVDTLYHLYSKLHRFDPNVVESGYAIRKRIIENNVYGVDVMEWAARIAELRLWLFLMVEADLTREKLWLNPLLPNLSFKIRVGDSLIEEFGNLDFSILKSKRPELKSSLPLSPSIKRKITELKKKKLLYAENKPGAPKKEEIEHEEFQLFKEIIDYKLSQIKREITKFETAPTYAGSLIGGEKESPKERYKKRLEELKKEKELWDSVRKALVKGKRPFIWDIDFVEVFYGEKEGFDLVIGNPPYVRQEYIAPPDRNEEDYSQDEWKKLKKEYKEKLRNMVETLYGSEFKPDGKADLYVYFYFKGLSLLNMRGTLGFITSNSWLDVGFGKTLQEFLLRRTKIYSINDNQSKRSFKEADVNTVITFISAPTDKRGEKENLENVAKFVMWKVPFEEIVKGLKFKEYLNFIEKAQPKVEEAELPELSENIIKTEAFRLFPIKQKDLLKDGMRDGKYEGNKWGGKFLRAPDIFFTILKKGKNKLVRLGDIAEVKRGFTTGANEFFYVEDLTDKVNDSELRRVENLKGFTSVEEIKKAGLRIIKPSKWGKNAKDYRLFLIEEEFLKPVIKSPRELKTIIVRKEDLKYRVFMCNKTRKELKETFALDYIKWGEEQGFNRRPTCRSRNLWYQISVKEDMKFLWWKSIGERYAFFWNINNYPTDQRNYYVELKDKSISDLEFVTSLNATLDRLFIETMAREMTGAITIIELPVDDVRNKFTFLVQGIEEVPEMFKREIFSVFKELGFDPSKPIREQEPNPLPDRKALDDIVFDALGLTEEERREVYYAVAELVQNRLKKAKNV